MKQALNRKSLLLVLLLVISLGINIKLFTSKEKQPDIQINIPATLFTLDNFTLNYQDGVYKIDFDGLMKDAEDYINHPLVYQEYSYRLSFCKDSVIYKNDTMYTLSLNNQHYSISIKENMINDDFKEVLDSLFIQHDTSVFPVITVYNATNQDSIFVMNVSDYKFIES